MFLLISFIVGLIIISVFHFIASIFTGNKEKQRLVAEQIMKLRVEEQKQKEVANIVDVVVQKTSTKVIALPCKNHIEGVVGVSIKKITRQIDRDYTTFYIYVHNLSKEIAPFSLKKAYYITQEGEQIEGSVTHLVTRGAENDVILPHLKAEAPITFYKKLENVSSSDILFVQLLFNNRVYSLSMYVCK